MVVPTVSAEPRERPGGTGTRRAAPAVVGGLRILLVAASGFALYEASPPRDLWWSVPLSLVPFLVVVRERRARAAFGYGALFGLAYLLPLMGWLKDFLGAQFGPWPWLAVCVAEAAFFGLAGVGIARVGRLRLAPVWIAAVFVAVELIRSSVPFGGFPWGRLAFTQASGPLVALASVGGSAVVTFAVVLIGAGLAELWHRARGTSWKRFVTGMAAAIVPVLAALLLVPTVNATGDVDTARVGVVQGNAPNIGLDLLYEDDELRANHIRGLHRFADQINAGQISRPDLVVLPEQVGSWGPTRRDPDLASAARAVGAPMVVGGLVQDRRSELYNRALLWDPAAGATEEYTKQHLVPFAETIPMRPLARLVTPFVDRFRQDMVAGNRPGVLDAGGVRLGVGLCFDVAFDDVFSGAARSGATLFAVPTNNAWYGHSEMSYQHLAMSQLRAVEHSRSVVVAATSGVSAIVAPDGTVVRQTQQFTAENVVAEVPLRSTWTWATRLGSIPAWLLTLLGCGAVAVTLRRGSRAR